MLKKIILFSVLLLMTPALALASTARLEGLGVMPDFIEDYANIFNYPVSICRYPAVVIGELGYVDGWGKGFGATMGLGTDNAYGVFGIELRQNSTFAPVPGTAGSPGSQFDLLWGMNFGKASVGLRFDRSNSELELTTDGVGTKFTPLYIIYSGIGPAMESWNTMGLGISGGLEVREADKVEATFEYRKLDFALDQIGGAGMSIEDKDNPSFGIWGRGFFAMAENITLVPMVGYNKYDFSWEFKDPTTPGDDDSSDQTLSNVRGALGMRVDMGSFFMVGLGFSQWKADVDNSIVTPLGTDPRSAEFTSTSMPFFFGTFEADLKDWLTIRFGAKKHLLAEKVNVELYDGTKIEYKTSNGSLPTFLRDDLEANGLFVPVMDEPFLFSMGLGFKWNDIEIDATLHEDYPFTGMYWLSGDSVTPFGKISVTYYY
jgi:opacity protein-like surface antigen